jgi:orotidine-5'-phosphate decarboxylase
MVDYPPNPVFCAVDTAELDRATTLTSQLRGVVGGLKLGLEFFTARGPVEVRKVRAGMPLFLDLKLHDTPNTVSRAVTSCSELEPDLMTVHAQGGPEMMRAAVAAAADAAHSPKIIAVTILTSLDDGDLDAVGMRDGPAVSVRRLAALAQQAGCQGAVCSPHEIAALRADLGPDFTLVVPGIRPEGAATGDQKRIMGPGEAMALGADILVVGRPITQADDPIAAASAIVQSAQATQSRA